ncbi:DUF2489 domain-containing protein [Rheinheimera oceanensis]|uniref:DUF2489 domain-containing protein n=1 Tax=Rheinheimera oceanensis TaxID=2817449 RepID=UPI001BFE408F|nr:DUF2489 domain-containing protein [Rheinheimera oceanensis]
MSSTLVVVIIVGSLIVAALAFYAGSLLWQLQQQNRQQQQQKSEKEQYLRDSITLICKAMLEQQCELSEGALRLWVLLDHLVPQRQPDPVIAYPGLHQMYQVVKDMPTHKARKEQDKVLTRQQDEVRLKAEQDLKDFILADTAALLQRFQPG